MTRRLFGALYATRHAIERSGSDGIGAFDTAVSEGVSANLCESLHRLIKHAEGLEISLAWAKTRPTPKAISRFAFSEADSGTLDEAARQFRYRVSKLK